MEGYKAIGAGPNGTPATEEVYHIYIYTHCIGKSVSERSLNRKVIWWNFNLSPRQVVCSNVDLTHSSLCIRSSPAPFHCREKPRAGGNEAGQLGLSQMTSCQMMLHVGLRCQDLTRWGWFVSLESFRANASQLSSSWSLAVENRYQSWIMNVHQSHSAKQDESWVN